MASTTSVDRGDINERIKENPMKKKATKVAVKASKKKIVKKTKAKKVMDKDKDGY